MGTLFIFAGSKTSVYTLYIFFTDGRKCLADVLMCVASVHKCLADVFVEGSPSGWFWWLIANVVLTGYILYKIANWHTIEMMSTRDLAVIILKMLGHEGRIVYTIAKVLMRQVKGTVHVYR